MQEQNALDMGKHLLGLEPSFISSADSFVRGQIKPSSEERTAWRVLAPDPPFNIQQLRELSSIHFSRETCLPPNFDAVLLW